ncbi:hypothetical protein ACFP6B_01915 [Rothia nasimurium]|uniref:hypothetical protein n=1 Tax=Rothia nasimurium TaxID=85336 RepID=UPI003610866C
MTISGADLDAWLDGLELEWTVKLAAEKGQIALSTLALQRKENRVKPQNILKIAEGFGRNKLQELARFKGYEAMWPVEAADASPWYVCVPLVDIVTELLVRSGVVDYARGYALGVASDACDRWHDVVAGSVQRKDVARQVGIPKNQYSRMIVANELQFDTIVEVSRSLGVKPHVGLVACGYLGLEDIGVVDVRRSLAQVDSEILLGELERQDRSLVRVLGDAVEDL